MPVQKFRSLDEMNAAPVPVPMGEGIERFLQHCARLRSIARLRYAAGVWKFRSLEEAQRAREAASAAARERIDSGERGGGRR
jgi:hypothetical protein